MKKSPKDSTLKPLPITPDLSDEVSNETNETTPNDNDLSTPEITANKSDNNSNFLYKYFFLAPVKCLEPSLGSNVAKALVATTYVGGWTAMVATLTKYIFTDFLTASPKAPPLEPATQEIKALCCDYTYSGVTDNCYLGYSNNPGITSSACNTKPKCTSATNALNNMLTCTTYDYYGAIIAEDSCNFKLDTSNATSCDPCCPKPTIDYLWCHYTTYTDKNIYGLFKFLSEGDCVLGTNPNSTAYTSCEQIPDANSSTFAQCQAYDPDSNTLSYLGYDFIGLSGCQDYCPE